MKTKTNLVILALLVTTLNVFSQNTKTRTASSSKSISISISDDENSYVISANFSSSDVKNVKEALEKYFGQPTSTASSGSDWKNEAIYSIRLKDSGNLKMSLDKENASEKLVTKFKNFGNEIDELLGAPSPPTPPNPTRPPSPSRD